MTFQEFLSLLQNDTKYLSLVNAIEQGAQRASNSKTGNGILNKFSQEGKNNYKNAISQFAISENFHTLMAQPGGSALGGIVEDIFSWIDYANSRFQVNRGLFTGEAAEELTQSIVFAMSITNEISFLLNNPSQNQMQISLLCDILAGLCSLDIFYDGKDRAIIPVLIKGDKESSGIIRKIKSFQNDYQINQNIGFHMHSCYTEALTVNYNLRNLEYLKTQAAKGAISPEGKMSVALDIGFEKYDQLVKITANRLLKYANQKEEYLFTGIPGTDSFLLEEGRKSFTRANKNDLSQDNSLMHSYRSVNSQINNEVDFQIISGKSEIFKEITTLASSVASRKQNARFNKQKKIIHTQELIPNKYLPVVNNALIKMFIQDVSNQTYSATPVLTIDEAKKIVENTWKSSSRDYTTNYQDFDLNSESLSSSLFAFEKLFFMVMNFHNNYGIAGWQVSSEWRQLSEDALTKLRNKITNELEQLDVDQSSQDIISKKLRICQNKLNNIFNEGVLSDREGVLSDRVESSYVKFKEYFSQISQVKLDLDQNRNELTNFFKYLNNALSLNLDIQKLPNTGMTEFSSFFGMADDLDEEFQLIKKAVLKTELYRKVNEAHDQIEALNTELHKVETLNSDLLMQAERHELLTEKQKQLIASQALALKTTTEELTRQITEKEKKLNGLKETNFQLEVSQQESNNQFIEHQKKLTQLENQIAKQKNSVNTFIENIGNHISSNLTFVERNRQAVSDSIVNFSSQILDLVAIKNDQERKNFLESMILEFQKVQNKYDEIIKKFSDSNEYILDNIQELTRENKQYFEELAIRCKQLQVSMGEIEKLHKTMSENFSKQLKISYTSNIEDKKALGQNKSKIEFLTNKNNELLVNAHEQHQNIEATKQNILEQDKIIKTAQANSGQEKTKQENSLNNKLFFNLQHETHSQKEKCKRIHKKIMTFINAKEIQVHGLFGGEHVKRINRKLPRGMAKMLRAISDNEGNFNEDLNESQYQSAIHLINEESMDRRGFRGATVLTGLFCSYRDSNTKKQYAALYDLSLK